MVFHIDVNSAFLSWEAVYRLAHKGGKQDLRKIASAVGGEITLRHGIILAKSIPAKNYGVKTGESIPEAKRKCPNLVLVPSNYSLYEQCSAAFMGILRDYSDVVEQYSIDEAFIDMSTSCHLFGTPEETAVQIKERIREELANADLAWLKRVLKKQGEIIWGFANGIDLSPVLSQPAANKGYGNSTTTPYDVTDAETADRVLLALSETVGNRLRTDRVQIRVVSVGIRYSDLSYVSHQKGLQNPTNLTIEIYTAACSLFRELWNGKPIRHLSVHTGRVSRKDFGRQLNLFDEIDYEKLARMDETVDRIRKRLGTDAVMRAAFLNQPIDHMTGGVSREKRSVDYDQVMIQ